MLHRLVASGLAVLLLAARPAPAQTLAVAAAADLQPVLPGLARQFEADSGHPVRVTFGSSGNFFAQIVNGAPFDVFLSADIEYPRALVREGKADAGSLVDYAVGSLVLWTRTGSGIDVQRGLAVTTDAAVQHIAIARPAHAPYGRAAVAALTTAGLYDAVHDKLVFGENISQVAQFVQSGNAQVGLLAYSLALAPALAASGTYVRIPASAHPPIVQAAVVIAASARQPIARRFIAFLQRDTVVRQLEAFGFSRP